MMISKTGIVYREDFLKHDTGLGHPETSLRLVSILDNLGDLPNERFDWIKDFQGASNEILFKVHTKEYVHSVQKTIVEKQNGYLDGDTVFSSHSLIAASLAAGSGVHLADAILDGRLRNGFAMVRPPGHHAESDFAMGFCIFNNIAITAKYLQSKGIKKILILDWDVHHGNGTQHMFYDDPNIYFISFHQFPFYPGTGSESERGIGAGFGTTLNFPLPRGSVEADYLKKFERIEQEMEEFLPDFILVSAGFDAHKADPLGGMNLSTKSFELFSRRILDLANRYCGGRVISFLEGGYDLQALAESVRIHLEVLGG